MKNILGKTFNFLLLYFLFCNFACANEKITVRVGHFPNVTHAQGVIGHHLTREGKGWFEKRLGPDIDVQWFIYDTGPSAMEAIFTGSIDMTYVGPSPTINAFLKSKGQAIRIISGSCSGGAALIVQPNSPIKTNADFKGKKIGTPEIGSTQDVAARAWLKSIGLNIYLTSGDALVIPTENSDQLTLFKQKGLDAVWTVEPWVSILVLQGDGKIYLEESSLWPQTHGKYVTTQLVGSRNFLKRHPEIAKHWVKAHVELTEWINSNKDAAKEIYRHEIKKEINFLLPINVLNRAWDHIELTYDPVKASLYKYAKESYQIGFLKKDPDLHGIYELGFLNEILKELGKNTINE